MNGNILQHVPSTKEEPTNT